MNDGPPLLEFDPTPSAVIEPSTLHEPVEISPNAVLCFFQEVIAKVVSEHEGRRVHMLNSEIGDNPVWEIDVDGRQLTIAHPGVGAPLAAAFLEELIAIGCRTFIACGAAGSLVPEQAKARVSFFGRRHDILISAERRRPGAVFAQGQARHGVSDRTHRGRMIVVRSRRNSTDRVLRLSTESVHISLNLWISQRPAAKGRALR